MKVSDLEGDPLDYWVARAAGLPLCEEWNQAVSAGILVGTGAGDLELFAPSTDWAHGGPIIELEKIAVFVAKGNQWGAEMRYGNNDWIDTDIFQCDARGNTPLIAAMRAFVSAKFGKTVSYEV